MTWQLTAPWKISKWHPRHGHVGRDIVAPHPGGPVDRIHMAAAQPSKPSLPFATDHPPPPRPRPPPATADPQFASTPPRAELRRRRPRRLPLPPSRCRRWVPTRELPLSCDSSASPYNVSVPALCFFFRRRADWVERFFSGRQRRRRRFQGRGFSCCRALWKQVRVLRPPVSHSESVWMCALD
jgi:hypothetical protein